MDRLGSADPYVEAYTTSTVVEETSVKKNTLAPKWNERLWLLVQEPSTQAAYLAVNDVDLVNVKELMRVNVLKVGGLGALECARLGLVLGV
jgi:Ca2+-dependent lipid-binding protein